MNGWRLEEVAMRPMFASRLSLAATLLAAIKVASPAAAESINYLKYDLHGFGPSQGSSAMNDLPTLPGGPSATQQPKANLHAAPGTNSASPLRRDFQAEHFSGPALPKALTDNRGPSPQVPGLPNHRQLNLKSSSLYGLSNMTQ
jgi:hypothetical protein